MNTTPRWWPFGKEAREFGEAQKQVVTYEQRLVTALQYVRDNAGPNLRLDQASIMFMFCSAYALLRTLVNDWTQNLLILFDRRYAAGEALDGWADNLLTERGAGEVDDMLRMRLEAARIEADCGTIGWFNRHMRDFPTVANYFILEPPPPYWGPQPIGSIGIVAYDANGDLVTAPVQQFFDPHISGDGHGAALPGQRVIIAGPEYPVMPDPEEAEIFTFHGVQFTVTRR